MEDGAIVDLFFKRSEQAISETKARYGRLLLAVSYGILRSQPDAEECENDTYLKAWQVIPPGKPRVLSAFLSRITRNLSLDRLDRMKADKRGGGEMPLLLDELAECIPDGKDPETQCEGYELGQLINDFLSGLKTEDREIFMRRYFFGDSVKEIASYSGHGESRIKMSLMRTREKLKKKLMKEGYVL